MEHSKDLSLLLDIVESSEVGSNPGSLLRSLRVHAAR